MSGGVHRKAKPADAVERAGEDVASRFAPAPRAQPKEKMIPVTFLCAPSDYAAMKDVAAELGLKIGAGLRFVLRDFLRRRGK